MPVRDLDFLQPGVNTLGDAISVGALLQIILLHRPTPDNVLLLMQQLIVQCFSFLVPLLDSTSEDAEDRLFFKSFYEKCARLLAVLFDIQSSACAKRRQSRIASLRTRIFFTRTCSESGSSCVTYVCERVLSERGYYEISVYLPTARQMVAVMFGRAKIDYVHTYRKSRNKV